MTEIFWGLVESCQTPNKQGIPKPKLGLGDGWCPGNFDCSNICAVLHLSLLNLLLQRSGQPLDLQTMEPGPRDGYAHHFKYQLSYKNRGDWAQGWMAA